MKILIAISILVIIIFIIIYNILINRKNKVLRSKSNIDIYLTQRFNLIPNLIKCVKEYTNYESNILVELTKSRTQYMQNKNIEIGSQLNSKLNKFIIQIEEYPDLKSNEQYILLEKNLVKMENQIQAARRIYNMDVLKYNNLVSTFPSNIVAKIMKLKKEKFFEKDEESKSSIKVEGD